MNRSPVAEICRRVSEKWASRVAVDVFGPKWLNLTPGYCPICYAQRLHLGTDCLDPRIKLNRLELSAVRPKALDQRSCFLQRIGKLRKPLGAAHREIISSTQQQTITLPRDNASLSTQAAAVNEEQSVMDANLV